MNDRLTKYCDTCEKTQSLDDSGYCRGCGKHGDNMVFTEHIFNKIYMLAENEAQWLHYYGYRPSRDKEQFDNHTFYDRLESIGYAKRVTELSLRCTRAYITGKNDKPVLECGFDELVFTSGPRNHMNNVFTPLEYVIGKRTNGYAELIRFIKE